MLRSDSPAGLPTASWTDAGRVGFRVAAPLVARGPIIRRPAVVRAIAALGLDDQAVRDLQRLDDRYGPDPVRVRIPGREWAVVLAPEDVHRVLADSPEPFAPATYEKRAALSAFQPHGLLASHGTERVQRRRFNEAVLDHGRAIHEQAGELLDKIVDEAGRLAGRVERTGRLTWDDYIRAWYRLVRRVVLGDAARDDHAVTDLLSELRAAGNWSLFRRSHAGRRDRFYRRLQHHLTRAESGSLAGRLSRTATGPSTEPPQQVPQWLFAYDAAAWASFRALALICAHPDMADRATTEASGRDLSQPHNLPFLRSCLLESLRLYPTTPAILRETTRRTHWRTGTLPAGSGVLVFAPYFHRDDRRLPHAHRFVPQDWVERVAEGRVGPQAGDWPLVPFSAGPAICPGRHLVLLTASAVLGTLLTRQPLALARPTQLNTSRLPGTLSPFHLSFATSRP